MPSVPALVPRGSTIDRQPRSKRYYFDVGIGSVWLSGADTGGAYCLLEIGLASGMMVPRHTHTRDRRRRGLHAQASESLTAPRNIPHQLRNSGKVENHYLIMFSPAGFEGFLRATAIPAPDDAIAPTEPPAVAIRNVHALAADYGILFH